MILEQGDLLNNVKQLEKEVELLRYQRRLSDVIPLCERILELNNVGWGADHPVSLSSLEQLGNAYYFVRRYKDSDSCYQRLISVLDKHPEANNWKARALHKRGLIQRRQQQSTNDQYAFEAVYLFEQALTLFEHTFGPEHPEILSTLCHLAHQCFQTGDLAKADVLYKRMVLIINQSARIDDPAYARMRSGYANFLRATGREEEAKAMEPKQKEDAYECLLSQQLREKTRMLGEEHVDVAELRYNLGRHYLYQGAPERAIGLFNTALAIREKVFGTDHSITVETLNSVADAYHKLQRLND